MKKVVLFLALISLLVIGCQDNNPVQLEDTSNSLSKAEPNWISLPAPIEKSLKKTFSDAEWIDVDRGGTVEVKAVYYTFSWWWWSKKTEVKAEASLYFAPHTWEKKVYGDDVKITLSIDDETATSSFDPHMEFEKEVIYNAKFTGLNLTGVDVSTIDFVYQDPNGTIEQIPYDALNIDVKNGVLEIVNARIPHFSRYGFTW